MTEKRVKNPFCADKHQKTMVFTSNIVPQCCPPCDVPSPSHSFRPVIDEKPKLAENRQISSNIVRNGQNVLKIGVILVLKGTVIHHLILFVGDAVRKDIFAVSAPSFVVYPIENTVIHILLKTVVPQVPQLLPPLNPQAFPVAVHLW